MYGIATGFVMGVTLDIRRSQSAFSRRLATRSFTLCIAGLLAPGLLARRELGDAVLSIAVHGQHRFTVRRYITVVAFLRNP